jgi:hypothetical protein
MEAGLSQMAYRFEFDPEHKILLMRYEGRLTEAVAEESDVALRKYWAATAPSMVIVDFSSVTEFAVSSEFVRRVAGQALIVDATGTPVAIVAPVPAGFGLGRMFQIVGEPKRPLLHVVRTMDEAFAALGVQSPHFALLE